MASTAPLDVPQETSFRLSPQQRHLWRLGLAASPMRGIFQIHGPLDAELLRRSLDRVVDQFEVLRTTFHRPPGWKFPVQIVKSQDTPGWRLIDLRHLGSHEERIAMEQALAEDGAEFDLENGPLLRALLLTKDDRRHTLVFTFPALVGDRGSLRCLHRALVGEYTGLLKGAEGADGADGGPLQYADFAEWQNLLLEAEDEEAGRAYWRALRTASFADPVLPFERKSSGDEPFLSCALPLELSAADLERLSKVASRYGGSLEDGLLAVWQVLLWRFTGSTRPIVGKVWDGRKFEELKDVFGPCSRAVPVACDLDGELRFDELLQQTVRVGLEGFDVQEYFGWEERIEAGEVAPGDAFLPFLFELDRGPGYGSGRDDGGQGLSLSLSNLQGDDERFRLKLLAEFAPTGVGLTLCYDAARFRHADVAEIAACLPVLVESVLVNPEARLIDLQLVGPAVRDRLVSAWNRTHADFPRDLCLHELFEAQARQHPSRTAVTFGDEEIEYGELDRRAGRLALYLQAQGVGPEVIVAIGLNRSLDMVVAVLGVLKAGGAYLPVDPELPVPRISILLEKSQTSLLLTCERLLVRFPTFPGEVLCLDHDRESLEGYSEKSLAPLAGPENLAYLVYTSGTTGIPKGVLSTHRGAVSYLSFVVGSYGLGSHDRILQLASLAFDASVRDLLGPLVSGATVILVDDSVARDPGALLEVIERRQITGLLSVVPSLLRALLAAAESRRFVTLRKILASGERLYLSDCQRAREVFPEAELVNQYGPTECTMTSSYYRVTGREEGREIVLIGRPISNVSFYVTDEKLDLVPVGLPGGLYIGGIGLARGYARRPDLTAESFLPNPFSSVPGERMYATGDRVRYLPEGELEFQGRQDHQVKIRGYRIEPGEIEAVLRRFPGVREAAVVAREDVPQELRLVAYVVPARKGEDLLEALRHFLQQQLPPYMLPAALVTLPALPLTPNGKLNRQALPVPEGRREGILVGPRTVHEEVLAAIWTDVLGIERVSVEDDFFDLGGHSLLATQLIARIRKTFQAELPLQSVFEHPTLARLTMAVEKAVQQTTPRLPPVVPIPRDGDLPLSFAQQRLWFLNQLEPGSAAYNLASPLRITGPLDVAVLAASLDEVIRRHESLRTTFHSVDGEPLQRIEQPRPAGLQVIDLGALEPGRREAEVAHLSLLEAKLPFDLSRGPLLRATLLRLEDALHVLPFTMHHIVSDVWSKGNLVREVALLYRAFSAGRPSPLPPLAIQYADFAAWQRRWLQGEVLESHLAFWKAHLRDTSAQLEMPFDRPRQAVQTDRGGRRPIALSRGLFEQLRVLSRTEGATLFMVLLAAFKTLLHRYNGQTAITVGTPVAGRRHLETEPLIGFFVNTLALQTDLAGNPSVGELVARVRNGVIGAYIHQDLPFERLVEELEPERDLGRSPLIQGMFILQGMPQHGLPRESLQIPGLGFTPLEIDQGTSRFDFDILLWEQEGSLRGIFEYSRDLFDAATIDRIWGHFANLLSGTVASVGRRLSELPLLSAPERHQLLNEWNAPESVNESGTHAHLLFELWAERAPQARAVTCGEEELSYEDLNARANRLARALVEEGVGPESLVALVAERGIDFLTAMLAIFKAGGAYLPLDSAYPPDRLAHILAASRAALILTANGLGASLPKVLSGFSAQARPRILELSDLLAREQAADNLPVRARPENLAYVIYTSGSTGVPKGAMVTERGMLNHLCAKIFELALDVGDRVAQTASQTFDISVWQFLAVLLTGGEIRIFGDDVTHDPSLLLDAVDRTGVTVIEVVPSLLGFLLDEVERRGRERPALAKLRWLIPTGEALPPDLCRRWFAAYPEHHLLNAYGPTECSDDVTHHPIRSLPAVHPVYMPIGRPVLNTRLHVLDGWRGLLARGVAGELCVGGVAVGRGYLGDPARTAEVFVPDPFASRSGARLYRTGDLARHLPDGALEFLGRIDHQVKIRGFRIELGEIEVALQEHPAVKENVVLAEESGVAGSLRLAAYVVPDPQYRRRQEEDVRDAWDHGKVEEWRAVFDDVYGQQMLSSRDSAIHRRVWISSYSGEPLPDEEILECVQDSVDRIVALRPRRVLEIGCGSGLVLSRVAPECESYWATDLSREVLRALQRRLDDSGEALPEITLLQRAADDFAGIPSRHFDVVILNEVVQYFPSVEYLVRVLEGAVNATSPGGVIFVGGVRSFPLLEPFHTMVQLHHALPEVSVAELRQKALHQMTREKELSIDPALFTALPRHLPRVTGVRIELKGGRSQNELTKFRYDSILCVDTIAPALPEGRRLDWDGDHLTLSSLGRLLAQEEPDLIRISRVPSARLLEEESVLGLLAAADGLETVGNLKQYAQSGLSGLGGVEPEDLWALGRLLPYSVNLRWSESHRGFLDAVFVKRAAEGEAAVLGALPAWDSNLLPWSVYANRPLQGFATGELAPELRDFVLGKLPDFMAPDRFIFLDALPLTSNGKIDRRALARTGMAWEGAAGAYLPPRTPTEEVLVSIWMAILGLQRVGASDNFFELGGHSLLATQVVSRLRTTLGVELPLRRLFEVPTVAGLAALVDAERHASDGTQAPPLLPASREGDLPLSFAQQRLWFLDRLIPDSPFYNMYTALQLRGRLEIPVLSAAVRELVRRHEILRTTFPAVLGYPVQRIAAGAEMPLLLVDLGGLPAEIRRRELERLSRAEAQRPFDLGRGPLLRATLIRLEGREHVLSVNVHHIVSDGWSTAILVNETVTLYKAFMERRPASLPALPIQYADFAVWQRSWLSGELLQTQLAFWKDRLAGAPAVLELPADRPRPAMASFRGAVEPFRWRSDLVASLRDLSLQNGATPAMTLLAAFKALLARISGQQDIVVGTAIANRNRSEIEKLIGFFVNTLVLRTDLAGGPGFQELIARVREVCLRAYDHQDLPFEKLVDELEPERSLSHNPLVQVMYVFQNFSPLELEVPELSIDLLGGRAVDTGTSKFDLTLSVWQMESGLHGYIEYSQDLFDATTIRRALGHLEKLFGSASAAPGVAFSELGILGEAERHQLLCEWNEGGLVDAVSSTLSELFEARVREAPDAVAVTFADQAWSYGELNRLANRLARFLSAMGLGPGARIGLCLERSFELVVAILGTVKAGGVYVPLDPDYPSERLAFMLADSGAAVVLTHTGLLERLPEELPRVCLDREGGDWSALERCGDEDLAGSIGPYDPAYVIYTSGSTGQPKGVVVRHLNVVRLFTATERWFGFGPADVWTLFHSCAFDFSVWELWGALLYGGRLVVVPYWASRSPELFYDLLYRERVTVLNQTPSAFHQLMTAEEMICREREVPPGLDLRLVIFGGEALEPASLIPWFDRHGDRRPELVNMYGITETTVHVTYRRLRREDTAGGSVIGCAIPDLRLYLLDPAGMPVPIGVPGELYVGGAGVALGYLGRAERTAERFVPCPFLPLPPGDWAGMRLYRTGDLARRLPNGDFVYLGRIDHQVKVRGFRIELGEIENLLIQHPAVQETVVLARPDASGDKRLVAYVVRNPDHGVAEAEGRAEQIDHWQVVFDGVYREGDPAPNPSFNIIGWDSTYTGEPIPVEDMREWLEDTVERILALDPRRVLEIGCGTGMILFRIASQCQLYTGTDLSHEALSYVSAQTAARQNELSQVNLLHRSAEQFDGIEPGFFDTVILNSVVQYFPSVEYLVEVLAGAIDALRDGGRIFLGDLRSLPLLPVFHADVELSKAKPDVSLERLRQRIQTRTLEENELFIAPEFFGALQKRFPRIARAEIHPRRGRVRNELTAFRYHVVLRIGGSAPAQEIPWFDWSREQLALDTVQQWLDTGDFRAFGIRNIPNARLAAAIDASWRIADVQGAGGTVGQLRDYVSGMVTDAVDPHDLWELARTTDYEVELGWACQGAEGRLDAVFRRRQRVTSVPLSALLPSPPVPAIPKAWGAYANHPLQGWFTRKLVPELRSFLGERLPDFMVPALYIVLDSLPLTANGKVDRQALPEPERTARGGNTPPRTPQEEWVASIWEEVLDRENIGIDDNFFDLGGDSIKAVRLAARLNEQIATKVEVKDLFKFQTVGELALHLEASGAAATFDERAAGLAQLERLREGISSDDKLRAKLPSDAEDIFPLSGIEQGLIYYSLLLPDEPIYHDQYVYLLRLDSLDRFFKALELLAARHSVFRSSFQLYDFPEPMKIVHRGVRLARDAEDLSLLSESEQRRRIAEYRESDIARKFTFNGDLLWRLKLFRLTEDLYCAVGSWHHAVLDGWSTQSFWVELNDLYARPDLDEISALPRLASDYKDFVAIMLGRKTSPATQAYWRAHLEGYERNRLPFNRTLARAEGGQGMVARYRPLGRDLLSSLQEKAKDHHLSMKVVCLSAHIYLLHVLAAEANVVTGVVTHSRPSIKDGDKIIGCFLNTVPVQMKVTSLDSPLTLMLRVNGFLKESKEHEVLLADIAAFAGTREGTRNPLFDTIFNFMDFHNTAEVEEDVIFEPMSPALSAFGFDGREMTNTLFDVEVSTTLGNFSAKIKYSPALFDTDYIDRALALYERILQTFDRDSAARLDAESLLSPAERELVDRFNGNAVDYPREVSVYRCFERRVGQDPQRAAVACMGRELTYGDLNREANRLARHLQSRGVRPGDHVGLIFERSVDLAVGLLAILKSGAAYVPIEPSYPAARKEYCLRQSHATRVLADREYEIGSVGNIEVIVPDLPALASYRDTDLEESPGPEDLAYTIYTSGSTGTPKGVMIAHHSVVNLVRWVNRTFGVDHRSTLLMLSSVCFDLSVYDLLGGLAVGARVVIARQEEIQDPAQLWRLVNEQGITFWDSVPSTMGLLLGYLEDLGGDLRYEGLQVVFLSGDWIPLSMPSRVRRFFPHARIISLGGATEGTVWSIFYPIEEVDPAWASIPYGRPLDNSSFHILGPDMSVVPPGVVGELFIGGVGVAKGYSGEPEKTAVSFVPDRFLQSGEGRRLYRTGDLGRMLPDGQIEFLGRMDNQVKIRGFRIELGEIEGQLLRHPQVKDAVVVARQDRTGEKFLCAYVVAPTELATSELKTWLGRALPEYMIPAIFIALRELPLTSNGKLDRRALPEPAAQKLGAAEGHVAPANEVEAALVKIWEEVLNIPGIGTTHDFFELGGHSLSAIQVLTRIRQRLDVDLPVRDFFEAPTISGMARLVAELRVPPSRAADGREDNANRMSDIIPVQERPEALPLSFAQERLWVLYKLDPASAAFNIGSVVRLSGRFRVAVLAAALAEVVRRHEAIRTNFREVEGVPVQIVSAAGSHHLTVADLRGVPSSQRQAEVLRLVEEEARLPFDLERQSLLRTRLLRLADDEHVAAFTMHHIVGDGWSMGVLIHELAELYESFSNHRPSPLPEPVLQYTDYAQWQRRWMQGDLPQSQLAYWRRQLQGPLPVLNLPLQRRRSPTPSFRGAAQPVLVPKPLHQKLNELGRQEGATLFMVMLSVFKGLLYMTSGQEDLLVGTNVANRNRGEIERLIGFFVNNLVLRTDLSGRPSFRELLRRVRDVALAAYANQDIPFEKVLADLQPQRYGSYAPLFQVMFVFQNFPIVARDLPELRLAPVQFPQRTASFDLTLMMAETAEGIAGSLIYDTDLFAAATMSRMADDFLLLLEKVVESPDQLLSNISLANKSEAAFLIDAFNNDALDEEEGRRA
jgi:amino acid adenylation domain-containing protein